MNIAFSPCSLRPFEEKDIPSLAKHANNRKVWENLRDGFPHPYTLEDAASWIQITQKRTPGLSLSICFEDECVGGIGVMLGQDVHSCTAELGYWLGEEFWGRGIVSQAVALYTDFVMKEFKLLRVFAEPYDHNPASVRILEKAGFEFEGILRKNAVKDGVVRDMLMYAKVAE